MESLSTFKLSSKQCGACNVALESDSTRRAHSKTEWHVENLRRRVGGLPPLDASTFSASTTSKLDTRDIDPEQDSSSSPDESIDTPSSEGAPEFFAKQCLFCNQICDSFEDNILHMQKAHGLFINNLDRLIVDLETLVRYLHLVIFGYHECLYCHSRRRTAEASQQHMLGKGHCSIDIQDPESEYRDFFNFVTEDTEDTGDGESDAHGDNAAPSARGASLSPGPLRGSVSPRTAGQAAHWSSQPHRPRNPVCIPPQNRQTTQSDNAEPTPTRTSPSSQTLTRGERRGISPIDPLANLSVSDQMCLAHIPPSQQRAVLAVQKKQLGKAQRAEMRNSVRVEMIGNKILTKHLISDIPARRLKYAWC